MSSQRGTGRLRYSPCGGDMSLLKTVLVLVLVVFAQSAPSRGEEPTEIKITAKKYYFAPSTIRVKRGDHVKLVITAIDRNHGLKLEAFHIDQNLTKGEPVEVAFTADQPGIFPFECSHFCGLGHKKMNGQLIVQ